VLSFFFYHTARVFVPLVLIVSLIYLLPTLRAIKTSYRYIFLISLFSILVLSFLLVVVFPGGKDRFNQVSIFGFPEAKLVLDEQLREDGMNGTPILLTRLFHNKMINYGLTFIGEYFS